MGILLFGAKRSIADGRSVKLVQSGFDSSDHKCRKGTILSLDHRFYLFDNIIGETDSFVGRRGR